MARGDHGRAGGRRTAETRKGSLPLDLDIEVRVILGEKVRIATRGIDAHRQREWIFFTG
jgi:autotransporter translocation and assembly factor TamB